MSDKRLVIAIVDDNSIFGKDWQTILGRDQRVQACQSFDGSDASVKNLKQFISREFNEENHKKNLDLYILLDVNLGENQNASSFLRQCEEQNVFDSSTSIWIVSGYATIDLAEYQKSYERVVGSLTKPLNKNDILRTLIDFSKKVGIENKVPWIQTLPFAARIISQKDQTNRSILYQNARWKQPFNRFVDFPNPEKLKQLKKDGEPIEQTKYGFLPDEKDQIGFYKLKTTFNKELPENYFLQFSTGILAYDRQKKKVGFPLDYIIPHIFDTLTDFFQSGTFFRHEPFPASNHGILKLHGIARKSQKYKRSDFEHEASELKEDFDEYLKVFRKKKRKKKRPELFARIRSTRKISEKNIYKQFLNRFRIKEKEPWLEIPIFIKRWDIKTNEKPVAYPKLFYIAGVFCLDFPKDKNRFKTSEDLFRAYPYLKNVLSNVVEVLTRALKEDNKTRKLKIMDKINAWDFNTLPEKIKGTGKTIEIKELFRMILGTVIEFSQEAESGTIATVTPRGTHLEIQAGIGKQAEPDMVGVRYPVDVEGVIPIETWDQKTTVSYPDFDAKLEGQKTSIREEKIKIAKESSWYGRPAMKKWISEWLQSVVSFPIRFGEEIVGVVTLYSRKKHAFTKATEDLVKFFFSRLRWFLKVNEEHERSYGWIEILVFHLIRGKMARIRHLAQYFEYQPEQELNSKEALKHFEEIDSLSRKAGSSLENINDLINEFSFDISYHQGSFDPLKIWEELKKEVQFEIDEKRIEPVDRVDTQARQLKGDPMVFERILEVLLDNAIKFSNKGGQVRIETRYDREADVLRWLLTNEGEIDQEKLELLGKQTVTADPDRKGMGIGLYVANRLARLSEAEINIRCQDKQVIAELVWPVR